MQEKIIHLRILVYVDAMTRNHYEGVGNHWGNHPSPTNLIFRQESLTQHLSSLLTRVWGFC